jgi:predicted DCC family thiol-disulfide oxidoreductase YuxK
MKIHVFPRVGGKNSAASQRVTTLLRNRYVNILAQSTPRIKAHSVAAAKKLIQCHRGPIPMSDILLYDGVCGLCNRFNQFILRRDSRDQIRFASLQGVLASNLLRRHGRDATRLDTLYVVARYGEPGERLYSKAYAVLFVLRTIGGIWSFVRVFAVLPSWLLDGLYDFVARRRYRIFGRYESCMVPESLHRSKFIDTGLPGV